MCVCVGYVHVSIHAFKARDNGSLGRRLSWPVGVPVSGSLWGQYEVLTAKQPLQPLRVIILIKCVISQNSTPLAIIFVYFFLLWQSIVINGTSEGWVCFIFQTLTKWVKAGIGAGQEPQERNWSWDHGKMLLTNLLLLFCSVFSSIHPRISCPGVTPPVFTKSSLINHYSGQCPTGLSTGRWSRHWLSFVSS